MFCRNSHVYFRRNIPSDTISDTATRDFSYTVRCIEKYANLMYSVNHLGIHSVHYFNTISFNMAFNISVFELAILQQYAEIYTGSS